MIDDNEPGDETRLRQALLRVQNPVSEDILAVFEAWCDEILNPVEEEERSEK